jgi:hypothetical protein
MAVDTKGNIFEKVDTHYGITFVREFRFFSDDPKHEWGYIRFYSIYGGYVITDIELGEFEDIAWGRFDKVGTPQNLLQQNTLKLLRQRTREHIEALSKITFGL